MNTPFTYEVYNGFCLPDRQSYYGRCAHKSDMVTRGIVESAFCKELIFITLTYHPKFLPLTYTQVKDLQIFRQRKTHKKVPLEKGHKWISKNSNKLDLSENRYRTKEVMTEYDFKNARFNARCHYGKDYDNPRLGLLVPAHLRNWLTDLRDDIRIYTNNPDFHLRYIANGEYG